jgi:acyl dehydratase
METYPERYFEDFRVGDKFTTPSASLSREESIEFARAYDPQPFHLEDAAAEASLFRKLAASGWLTTAITMGLIVRSGFLRGPAVLGIGIDDLRWLAPVYPGDTLRVEGEVLELIGDTAGKRRGRMRVQIDTINQDNVRVMSYVANLSVIMRPPGKT